MQISYTIFTDASCQQVVKEISLVGQEAKKIIATIKLFHPKPELGHRYPELGIQIDSLSED